MTTGTFTIPLMRRTGYRPAFAGAVEAVASTGGQLMPPIMGGRRFCHGGIPSRVPAISPWRPSPSCRRFSITSPVFMAVHFEAKRIGLKGIPKPGTCRAWARCCARRGQSVPAPVHHYRGVLLSGYSAAYAALCGIGSVIPTTWLRSTTRYTFTPKAIIEALEAGARNTLVGGAGLCLRRYRHRHHHTHGASASPSPMW